MPVGEWLQPARSRHSRTATVGRLDGATIFSMAAFHESIDFTGKSELPRGWEEDVFRYCTFSGIELEGKAFGGILSACTVSDSSWYWGLFNLTRFIEVEFRNCVFSGSAFAGCIFAKCSFQGCRFLKDNLNADCSFPDCLWYDCEQEGCEGMPRQFASEIKRHKR
jgi:uncharacterized protein YjbI with pentapeptide repeats